MPNGATESWRRSSKHLREGIESSKVNRAKEQEPEAAEFRRALDAGEMPPLRPFVFITDYSPSDLATMLQSGGVQLLDVQTLMALRNDESVIRWGLSPHGALSKIKRRTDRAESRPGHFLLLRSGHQEIAKTSSRSIPKLWKQTVNFANELERTHTELLETNPSRTPTKSINMNPTLRIFALPLFHPGREFRVGGRLSGADRR